MARALHQRGHAEHAQLRVLALLRDRHSMNQRELLEMLNVRSASLSEILGKLEHRGFIERGRDERDKRGFVVSVTGPGAATAAASEDLWLRSAEDLFASLSGEERRRLAELLEKLVRAWEEESSGSAFQRHHHHHHAHGQGRERRAAFLHGRHDPGGEHASGGRHGDE
ncbi:MAG: MarR family transcriptional regulator [Deltaproteobacteria bacterium]|nr:MarR family transcriptional regulator [Deltaproteobacteria bacterium]